LSTLLPHRLLSLMSPSLPRGHKIRFKIAGLIFRIERNRCLRIVTLR
jgi:hypothetical protein